MVLTLASANINLITDCKRIQSVSTDNGSLRKTYIGCCLVNKIYKRQKIGLFFKAALYYMFVDFYSDFPFSHQKTERGRVRSEVCNNWV